MTRYNVFTHEPEYPGDGREELRTETPLDFHGALDEAITLLNEAQALGYYASPMHPVRTNEARLHWSLAHNRDNGKWLMIEIRSAEVQS